MAEDLVYSELRGKILPAASELCRQTMVRQRGSYNNLATFHVWTELRVFSNSFVYSVLFSYEVDDERNRM